MLTIRSGEKVARAQACLLVVIVRIAGAQQTDPGVLVEFGYISGGPSLVDGGLALLDVTFLAQTQPSKPSEVRTR